jgi:gluconolactonase
MHKILVISLLVHIIFASCQQNNSFPNGKIQGPFAWKSKIYPGTERNYWLYVPQQYDSAKPACVMVVQDGIACAEGWRLPAILDELIANKEVPVMIGVFIDHGTTPSRDTASYPRFNRSLEYDAMGDRYARFLLEEILPEVSRTYNLSTDAGDRSIAGASSGAICAFNVAWERPDAFRRVFSSIGTYVGLRGADEFATLVRKTEPKPLRIFMDDGTRDLNIYAGDWWIANQNMLSALKWAGYEVDYSWKEGGGHDNKHTRTILADALRWLWKDYPASIQTHTDSIGHINILLKDQPWKEISLHKIIPEKLTVNKSGELYFGSGDTVYRNDANGNTILFASLPGKVGGLSFHSDSSLYACDLTHHKIISIDVKQQQRDIVTNVNANFMTISNKGIYFSDTEAKRIGFYNFENKQIQYIPVPGKPTGLAISSEQTFMNIGFEDQVLGYSFKIVEDGMLEDGQEYIHYHIPYAASTPGIKAFVSDTSNLLYSATTLGIQVSDQMGRINFIIANPAVTVTDLKIGGSGFNVLYACGNGRLFQRKINTKGILPWMPAVKPPRPKL